MPLPWDPLLWDPLLWDLLPWDPLLWVRWGQDESLGPRFSLSLLPGQRRVLLGEVNEHPLEQLHPHY